MTPLLQQFLSEARDFLQGMEKSLLRLEGTPGDAALINEVFRAVHTLKGSSGLFDVVALTRLMHSAEDVLGAVRAEHMTLNADLVDQLLGSLDQVKTWVDHLERHDRLPDDADRVSAAMATELRKCLPQQAVQAADDAAPAGDLNAEGPRPAEISATFSLQQRFAAFEKRVAGEDVSAIVYHPDETCFFSGEDPFNLVMQSPGLIAVQVSARAPWPPLADLDPYRCNLNFDILCCAGEDDLLHLFRYVSEQVRVNHLHALDLIGAVIDDAAGADKDRYSEVAAAGDLSGLRAILDARGTDSGDLSSLGPWLTCALEAPNGDETLIRALLQRIAAPRSGDNHPSGTDPHLAMRRILAAQEVILRMPGFSSKRLTSVATVLRNIALDLNAEIQDSLQDAVTASLAESTAEPLLRMLTTVDAAFPPPGRPASDPAEIRAPQRAERASGEAGAAQKILKVDPDKIDLLMNLIGELVVSKNALPFLAKKAEEMAGARALSREIKEHYAVFDRLAQEMQRAIMDVRMLPVSEAFDRFPRLIRDISRKLGRKVHLVIKGEDTAADKTIIEALGDPLLHVMRNAIDHGVEDPDERVRAGKPAEARILLRAYQEADGIVIEVSDDGRGIDPVKIRAAAIGKGLLDAERAARLTDQEAVDLIFAPGFSTASEISDLSGRGVGMDVVRSVTEQLGGRATITSKLGEGTQVRLALPLSMAVTKVILIKVGESLFGIPLDLVVETVRLPAAQIVTIKQSEAFVLRDKIIPLIRAAQLLGTGRGPERRDEEAILVCRVNGATTGLVIDDFCESMDIILKPMDGLLAGISAYSGTALLGDGSVLLILNLKELL